MISRALLFPMLMLAVACGPTMVGGGDAGPGSDGSPGDGSNPDVANALLELVGSATVTMSERAETSLTVRYLEDPTRAPVAGFVTFALEGADGGASLDGASVETDRDGLATINLRSGSLASFRVVASAYAADSVAFDVTVTNGEVVSLRVTPTYEGDRRISDVHIGLFTNYTCSQFVDLVPSPRMVETATRLNMPVTFEGVDTAAPSALYSLGVNSRGNIAVFDCHDLARNHMETDIEVPLVDVRDLEGGVFITTEKFDVTEGLPAVLDFTLNALSGLATDPGGWLIDFAVNSGVLPSWAENILRDSRPLIRGYLTMAIEDLNRPGYVDDILAVGDQLERLFNELTLVGDLTISEADEFGMGTAIHRLNELRVRVGDEMVSRPLNETANDVSITFTDDRQTIAAHSFALSFGEILEIVINEIMLPLLPGEPNSIGELLTQLISCDGLANADWLPGGESEAVRDTVELACDAAVMWAGNRVNNLITSTLDYDTLTLSGMGETTDADMDYRADNFEGDADAVWSGGPGSLEFTGELTGMREGDPTERQVDRVWEKIQAAL